MNQTTHKLTSASAYEQVTARLVAALEAGTVPWRKSWRASAPVSIRGHHYRGINLIALAFAPYASPVWVTFNQARELGGSVRKGEKGASHARSNQRPVLSEVTARDPARQRGSESGEHEQQPQRRPILQVPKRDLREARDSPQRDGAIDVSRRDAAHGCAPKAESLRPIPTQRH